jgi:hypothetical protein
MPPTHTTNLRVNCQLIGDGRLDSRQGPGVLISDDDVEMLRFMAGRGDLCVAFMYRRRPIYEGYVRIVLQQLVYLNSRGLWYLPTITPPTSGPLRRALPASLAVQP